MSVQDAMRSLGTVCQDIKKAIKKLDKLLRVVKVGGRGGGPACKRGGAQRGGGVALVGCARAVPAKAHDASRACMPLPLWR